jgi:hypothetical protein
MQRPPDANHPWRYDETRRGWFYLVNGNHRIYHDSTPRFTPSVGQQAPSGSNYQHAATGPSGAGPGGSLPIAIRSGLTAQPGRGPIRSPDSANSSQYLVSTGLSPHSQSPDAGRFQRQSSLGGASPPANLPPAVAGRGGGFSPPPNALRTGAGRGAGFSPPANPSQTGAGRGRGFIPPAGGLQPGQVDSAITQATNDAPTLTKEQQQKLDES